MYGHGAAPPTRSAATVITLRVLFAAVGFLSCGLLACVPLFRIAILRGKTLDWAAAWVSLPLSITCLAVVGSLPEADPRTDAALAAVLLLGAGASAYFLTVDIRFHNQLRRYPGHPAFSPHTTVTHTPGVPAPYGYPQPASPYAPTPVPQQPQAPHTPVPGPPASHGPHPAPAPGPGPRDAAPAAPVPPQRPAPARIDQVRAELDELSDYLRRRDGQYGQHGDHEGGR
ncbi:hypothetical protein [Streptomyces sp. Tu 3180]|uniref:hypothetical protein n=1 Tax=Streptomyces sp. Tu 3180 TaxID=2682611 RepID=UPI00135B665D|nr:hypothetical protein [Streptomyces sp. Tu 3180]KAF3465832.1 hypothetical protein GL259_16830 [Streptomyces sp. Tu 3180]